MNPTRACWVLVGGFFFTSSGQRLVEKSLGCLAGAAVPAAHAAPVLLSVRAEDVVAAHVL